MGLRRVVLWDIDHTLIDTRGVGRKLSGIAFERATGLRMEQQAQIDGITEPVIFRETAKLHGLQTGRRDFERFAQALAEAHVQHAAELRERGHALPGAAAALDAMAAVPEVAQTVVTGNVRPVAETKLGVFGLDRHIRWEMGAYGEDADERAELVSIALQRSGAAPTDAVLVDDTPAGVAAGIANRVKVIAVATGRSSATELAQAGAHVAVADLTDIAAIVSALSLP